MWFKIVGPIDKAETIAAQSSIHEIKRLRKIYGPGRWLKRKGIAQVELPGGRVCKAEIHWYEAHGIGKKEFKVKQIL